MEGTLQERESIRRILLENLVGGAELVEYGSRIVDLCRSD